MNKYTEFKEIVGEDATGKNIYINGFKIQGKNSGPTVYIQAALHGAEIQGNVVIYKLIEFFKNNEFSGEITLVPHANPIGANVKSGTHSLGRFDTVTGENWNRSFVDLYSIDENHQKLEKLCKSDSKDIISDFKNLNLNIITKLLSNPSTLSRSRRLSLNLQKLSASADILLDLHTGPTATEYLYCSERQINEVEEFKIKNVINIPNEFSGAMDESFFINWHRLDKELEKLNKPKINHGRSFTVELGSEETVSEKSADYFFNKILGYLGARGILNFENPDIADQIIRPLKNFKTIYAPAGGLYEFSSPPGSKINKGENLVRFMNLNTMTWKEIIAEEDCIVINHCPSSQIHSGMELVQILTL